jgi:hypothetical protein
MGDTWAARFADRVCEYRVLFWYLLWANVAFLLLGLFAWQYTVPGTPSRLILLFDLGLNTVMILTTGVVIVHCGRTRRGA